MFNITPLAVRATIPELPLQVVCRCASICLHVGGYNSTFVGRVQMRVFVVTKYTFSGTNPRLRAMHQHVFVVA